MLYRVGNGWSYGEGCQWSCQEKAILCQFGDTRRVSVIGNMVKSLGAKFLALSIKERPLLREMTIDDGYLGALVSVFGCVEYYTRVKILRFPYLL